MICWRHRVVAKTAISISENTRSNRFFENVDNCLDDYTGYNIEKHKLNIYAFTMASDISGNECSSASF